MMSQNQNKPNTDSATAPPDERPGWFDRPENVRLLIIGLIVVCVVVVVAELIFPNHHPHFAIEKIPGFQAAFGFAAFVVVVMLGKALRVVVSREEDYYDR